MNVEDLDAGSKSVKQNWLSEAVPKNLDPELQSLLTAEVEKQTWKAGNHDSQFQLDQSIAAQEWSTTIVTPSPVFMTGNNSNSVDNELNSLAISLKEENERKLSEARKAKEEQDRIENQELTLARKLLAIKDSGVNYDEETGYYDQNVDDYIFSRLSVIESWPKATIEFFMVQHGDLIQRKTLWNGYIINQSSINAKFDTPIKRIKLLEKIQQAGHKLV
jgi:hypothetical protein